MKRSFLRFSPLFVALGATFFSPACGDEESSVIANDGGVASGDGAVRGDGAVLGDGAAGDSSATDAKANVDGNASVDAGPCLAQPPTLPALKILDVSTSTVPNTVFAMQAPGSDDWYMVEQSGRVHIIRAGALLPTAFLDISAGMGNNLGERGLLSIAFHPGYATNGRFFVMGTPADSNDGSFADADADAVVEYKRDPSNADVADPAKVRDIVVLPTSEGNHNGGTILFGPDGFLYVGTGDGGGGCESSKPGQVQDATKLFGKILRLDVNAAAPFAAAGNPFADDSRVFHYGLRNPFRINIDSTNGDLFIGDVGQEQFEEISVASITAGGKNFGWPGFEGNKQGTCGGKAIGGPSPHTPPIVSIDRQGNGPFADYKSIIAGRVYRGTSIPALQGVYLFADYAGAEVGAIRYCGGQVYGPVPMPKKQIATPTGTLGTVSSFVEGHDGELYVTYNGRLGKFALK